MSFRHFCKEIVLCIFLLRKGILAQKGQSETTFILLLNFQRGCNEFCLVSSNSIHDRFSKMFQIFGPLLCYQIYYILEM